MAESQEAVTSLLSSAPPPPRPAALPPPFTLQELYLPLIDTQTCNHYYLENSGTVSPGPVILQDMLCAGFETGQKDACGVSKPPPCGGRGLPLPITPEDSQGGGGQRRLKYQGRAPGRGSVG